MHKKALYSTFLFLIIFFLILLLPSLQLWQWGFWYHFDHVRINTIIANGLGYLCIFFVLWQFKHFAGINVFSFIIPTVTLIYLLIFSYFIFTRLGYSRHVLLTGYSLNLIYYFLWESFLQKYQIPIYALLPFGRAKTLITASVPHIKIHVLNSCNLNRIAVRGVIADLHSPELDKAWEKFLAQCTLHHIPVFHIKQFTETVTGRIQIDHLSENQFGSLLPSPFYMISKRLIDIIIVLFTLPLTLNIMLLTAIAIKLESKGLVFFTQNRVGQGNKDFKIYKFRSMTIDAENDGAMLAQSNDMRITKVGIWIRKTRIDELPQIWNVLKGDMSLIGPRPEQRTFVNQFEESIPFYIYRHAVKPGMTGWAQVMQGYASNEDETLVKIQYDFYYIKHFSFWLDILILLKTFRVIITGFGAK